MNTFSCKASLKWQKHHSAEVRPKRLSVLQNLLIMIQIKFCQSSSKEDKCERSLSRNSECSSLTGWDDGPSPAEPVPAPHTAAAAVSSPVEDQAAPVQTKVECSRLKRSLFINTIIQKAWLLLWLCIIWSLYWLEVVSFMVEAAVHLTVCRPCSCCSCVRSSVLLSCSLCSTLCRFCRCSFSALRSDSRPALKTEQKHHEYKKYLNLEGSNCDPLKKKKS